MKDESEDATRIDVGNRVTIFRRGKKKIWNADFWLDGEHRRKSLRTGNKKVAIDRATKLGHELLHGTYQAIKTDVTLAEAIENFLNTLRIDGKARGTVKRYGPELESFRIFCEQHRVRRVSQITPALFDRYCAMRREAISHNTMSHEGTVIKQFCNWCVSRRHLAVNPLAGVRIPKPIFTPRRAPTLAEVQRIFGVSTVNKRVEFAVLAFTGMRSGELRQLRVEDVDLANGWLHIVSRKDARTKTGTSRKVPMHPVLRELLQGLPRPKGPWFFSAEASGRYPDGTHWINCKKLNEYFLAKLTKLELPGGRSGEGYTLHSLRHFFETYAVNAGIPQRVVDAWLGHKSDRSMAAVYYHLSDEQSQAFMQRLDFSLSPAASQE